ncbi:ClpXP protease specificity-enhancing factor [Rhodoferax ferrireducens]|uniref:ClpXP protease specificity-enhancing factor n=1 Tax=Rhodoferax ferrireducens TaxID=192843 RepID=UPI003BB6A45D
MIDATDTPSTRPYLIRALYEWCTDNGFTPYLAVAVDDSVRVPREYVKDGQIVLNLSLDATSSLQLGNDFIEFKARFGGTAREIVVPVHQVSAIYARENGQGMAFPLSTPQPAKAVASASKNLVSVPARDDTTERPLAPVQLTSVESEQPNDETGKDPNPPRPPIPGARPALTRVK